MPCYTRMKTIFLQGVIWLCLLNLGFVLTAKEPGYLDFDNLPDTNFSCVGKVIGGYYADLETNCQMFHVCTIGQLDEPMDIRFLCLNGTVFDQETRVCERVDEVDCSKSERFYHLNLELYGNTAPPILEESEETESPIISSTTSSTTTSRPTTTTRASRATFYTTPTPNLHTTTHSTPKVITSNQFPINSGPDIRFNPEEINIRLTPGSAPIIKSPAIKSPSVSYQQQAFNGGDARITVTTHTAVYKNDKIGTSQKSVPNFSSSTHKPKSVVSYGLTHSNNQQMYHQHKPQPTFDYTSYQQTDNTDIDYHTDLPSSEYSYHDDHIFDQMNYQSSNKKPQTQIFSVSSTTKRTNSPSFVVSSTAFPPSLKQQHQHYNYQRTDKPHNLQLPVPLFPTLSPLTFSSPAPFTLTRHFEQKRSNDHQQRPRIIVSASASVSDASGRRLNYSLGTIGTSHLIPKAPHTYDEYKEDDVGLDPFYHDVPKVKSRQRRDLSNQKLEQNHNYHNVNSAKEELSSVETETTTHWIPPEYVDDNYEPLTYNVTNELNKTTTEALKQNDTKPAEVEYEYYYEYIDDNYEPSMYNETKENSTDVLIATTKLATEPSIEITTHETTLEVNTVTEPYQDIMVSDATTQIPEEQTVITTEQEITTNIAEIERRSGMQIGEQLFDIATLDSTISPTTTSITTPTTIETTTPITTETTTPITTETTTPTSSLATEYFVPSTDEVETTTQEITTLTTEEIVQNSTEALQEITTQFNNNYSTTNTETTLDVDTTVPSTTEDLGVTVSTDYTTVNTDGTTIRSDSITLISNKEKTVISDIVKTTNEFELTTSTTENQTPIFQILPETTEVETTSLATSSTTTTTASTTTGRYNYLKPRERYFKTRPTTRHRFSSPSIHLSPSLLKLGTKMVNQNLDSISEESIAEELNHRIQTNNVISDSQHILTTVSYDDVTEAPLSKSANPTESKTTKSSSMPTTPITKTLFIPRRFTYDLTRSFNCFGKELNKFYEDPRDCRLFHYCTPGYTQTQVLDMKYVCDYGTYFDSDKLICAKVKPQRCKVSTKQV